jgi:hypothetical protein
MAVGLVAPGFPNITVLDQSRNRFQRDARKPI